MLKVLTFTCGSLAVKKNISRRTLFWLCFGSVWLGLWFLWFNIWFTAPVKTLKTKH